ncbi:Cof-type HAD-IIB family hydrolase [Streptococcus orisratti]|uniref:Cof-type HAD-IIB family hydrolase n=1 Tax=Streptococcus orisratti TaxID=114652 RepID=UPI003CFF9033
MTRIKLLALDMDATLFTTDKRVTTENRIALKAAEEKGVHVVITTGRPLPAIKHVLEDLQLYDDKHYSVTFNGGLVQRNNGEILDKNVMSRDQLRAIYAILEPLSLPMDVLSDGIVYSISSQGNDSLYHIANPMLTFQKLPSFEEIPENIIYNKVVVVIDSDFLDQQITKLPKEFYQQFEVFKSRDIILEIMPKGIHKAAGLELLIKHLDVKQEEVMAMGDEENDLSMLEWAGWGVAMANGVPLAKEKADAVTRRTNDQSGVAEAIREYILSEE